MIIVKEADKGLYFKRNHAEVIVFDTIEQAQGFVHAFYQYAMSEMSMVDPFEIPQIVRSMHAVQFEEIPDVSKLLMKTVMFSDILKEKRK